MAEETTTRRRRKAASDDVSPLAPPTQKPPPPEQPHPEERAPAASAAAPRPDPQHLGLVDGKGQPVTDLDGLFTEPVKPSQFVTVRRRIYEQYVLPGTKGVVGRRLIFPAGTRITMSRVREFKATYARAGR